MIGWKVVMSIINMFCRPSIHLRFLWTNALSVLMPWDSYMTTEDKWWIFFMVTITSYIIVHVPKSLHPKSHWNKGQVRHTTWSFYSHTRKKSTRKKSNKTMTTKQHQKFLMRFSRRYLISLQLTKAICCLAKRTRFTNETFPYNSDSVEIAVNNCAPQCFTTNKNDYIDNQTKMSGKVHGVGTAKVQLSGTVA